MLIMEPMELFIEFTKRSVFVIGIVCVLGGVCLTLFPKALLAMGDVVNRYISMDVIEKRLEQRHSIDDTLIKLTAFRIVLGVVSIGIGSLLISHCYFLFIAPQ